MSLYVLDTDILSLYQVGNLLVCRRVEDRSPEEVATTIITVEEQLSGWYTLRRRVKGREQIARVYDRFVANLRFIGRLQIVSFSEQAIDRYHELLRRKLRVRANDLRIAAIALEHSATIVTRNQSDFGRISGLNIEDWSAESVA